MLLEWKIEHMIFLTSFGIVTASPELTHINQSEGDPNGLCDLPAREKGDGSERRIVVVVQQIFHNVDPCVDNKI